MAECVKKQPTSHCVNKAINPLQNARFQLCRAAARPLLQTPCFPYLPQKNFGRVNFHPPPQTKDTNCFNTVVSRGIKKKKKKKIYLTLQ